jgi:hypothetical protein
MDILILIFFGFIYYYYSYICKRYKKNQQVTNFMAIPSWEMNEIVPTLALGSWPK